MTVSRILTTLLAAAAVSGGITVAVAQGATPQRQGVEPDSGALSPRNQIPAASSKADNSTSAPAAMAPAAMAPAASEPAAQPTRG
jgi:hypothetical protein